MSKYSDEKRFQLMEFLGNRCSCSRNGGCWHDGPCQVDDDRCLQIDHIRGGGSVDIRLRGGNGSMVVYYLKHLDEAKRNLQVLCSNCNWVKRDRNNEVNSTQSRWLNRLVSKDVSK